MKRRNPKPENRPHAAITSQLIGKLLILVLSLLVVVAIGIGASITAHSTPIPTPTALSTPTSPADTIQFASIQETPTPGAVEVQVALAEFSIVSSVTVFHAGVPYYFVVSNRGHQVHEFMIMPDKPDGSPLPPDVQYKDKLIEIEQIEPGSTLYINFMFAPTAVGRYEIACLMRGHYQAGMKRPIVVTR
ncbi:MAG TPA: hypothetical protein VKR83_21415 [Ktedonobacteraceae bacterium]|nr:hypothetical protein [Ktedonobacteraceae bacterium]